MTTPEGWTITLNQKPIPDRSHDWDFGHTDYDGSNGLAGTGSSEADCLEQIKLIEAEL